MTGHMSWDDEDSEWYDDALVGYATTDIDDIERDDDALSVSFTVTNPAGTISATSTIGGVTREVELSPSVCSMTESQLADEILLIASLAAQKAQAAQYAVVRELLCLMGHDSTTVDGLLQRTVGLPTPAMVDERTAEVFSASYSGNEE